MVIVADNTVIADFTVIGLWFPTNLAGFAVSIGVELGFLVDLCLFLVKLFRIKDGFLILVKRN